MKTRSGALRIPARIPGGEPRKNRLETVLGDLVAKEPESYKLHSLPKRNDEA